MPRNSRGKLLILGTDREFVSDISADYMNDKEEGCIATIKDSRADLMRMDALPQVLQL